MGLSKQLRECRKQFTLDAELSTLDPGVLGFMDLGFDKFEGRADLRNRVWDLDGQRNPNLCKLTHTSLPALKPLKISCVSSWRVKPPDML